MKNLLQVVLVCLLFNFLSALTQTEIESITARNDARNGCDGYITVQSNEDEDSITISRDGWPDHDWGCSNPHAPSVQESTVTLPNKPVDANSPYCLPMSDIGIALNGVAYYNALAAGNNNAMEGKCKEIFDCCGGHSSPDGKYHYHGPPKGDDLCDNPVFDISKQDSPQFIGVALDGYPIYGEWEGLDASTLDECHGTEMSDGQYAYIAVTSHFPYIMGCFKAKPNGLDDSSQMCEGMKAGQLCSCEGGIFNYDDVTEAEVTTSKKTELSNDFYKRLLIELIGGKKIRSKRSVCYGHNFQCEARGYTFSNDQCICESCEVDADCFPSNMGGNSGGMGGTLDGNMGGMGGNSGGMNGPPDGNMGGMGENSGGMSGPPDGNMGGMGGNSEGMSGPPDGNMGGMGGNSEGMSGPPDENMSGNSGGMSGPPDENMGDMGGNSEGMSGPPDGGMGGMGGNSGGMSGPDGNMGGMGGNSGGMSRPPYGNMGGMGGRPGGMSGRPDGNMGGMGGSSGGMSGRPDRNKDGNGKYSGGMREPSKRNKVNMIMKAIETILMEDSQDEN